MNETLFSERGACGFESHLKYSVGKKSKKHEPGMEILQSLTLVMIIKWIGVFF